MPPQPHTATTDATAILAAARAGDNTAWTMLVARFDGKLRSVARGYRLSSQDVDDAVQNAWVKLYEHIDGIRDGAAIGAWLATTVRREALRILQGGVRERLSDTLELDRPDDGFGPDAQLLERERSLALGRALQTLPGRQRELMTLIACKPDANYREIGATLDMPIGSIGPIRARGLARLQHHPELLAVAGGI